MRALLAAAVTAAGGDMTRKWTTAEGLPENTVTALAQSTDGYLWITTPSGVARFDGIRFETYQSPDIPAMPPPVPDRMLVDADGVTWRGRTVVCYAYGLVSFCLRQARFGDAPTRRRLSRLEPRYDC